MSDNFVNQVTLDCLVNKEFYNKHIANQAKREISRSDKKFYRKRVYNLTRELLLSKEEPPNLFPDVKHAFDHFINTCIHYFKTIDNNDIIQSDYQSVKDLANMGSTIPELNVDDIHSKEEADKLLMRTIQINNSLDNFIKRKRIKPPEKMILPKQKDVNLKDPSLKLKGISKSIKKKNIINTYEDKKEKQSEKEIPEHENKKKNEQAT